MHRLFAPLSFVLKRVRAIKIAIEGTASRCPRRVFPSGRKGRMSKVIYQLRHLVLVKADLVIYGSECKRAEGKPSFYVISVTVRGGRSVLSQGRRHLRENERDRTRRERLREGPLAIGSDPRTHNYTLARRESEREGERERETEYGFVHAQHFPTRRASRHEEFRSLIYSWPDPAVVHRGVRFDCASL